MTKQKELRFPLNLQLFAGEEKDLKTLSTELTQGFANLKGLLDQQADEIRTHGTTHHKTAEQITAQETKISTIDTEVKGIMEQFKALETKMNRPGYGSFEEEMSAGETFVKSEAYKAMMASGGMKSDNVNVKFNTKATLTSGVAAGGAGNLTTALRLPEIIAPNNRVFRLRDLLAVQGTTNNAITFIQETGFTNAAAPAPETTQKPESSLTFGVKTESVKTIAHWIPATRQIIADAPMLQNYVNNRLMYGLAYVEEAQILYGSGAGENLQGIMTNANVQVAGAIGAATMIDYIRAAITKATLAGYPVTGIVLNPVDWAALEVMKGTDGHYLYYQAQVNGAQPRLWAVPVVESLGMAQGEFLLGAFGLGAQLWDREDANVRVSESHSDYFTKNMLAILAEQRCALTTYRPEAFVKGDLTP